ncbi:MAG TPA: prenyltransferase/squalene oxidase repeat-containing protein [Pseudonocardiaceae bacterium]|nr:prenyltransferase/squalene oxidase repeat-containing protein [Pseudonocardiaceae bacterium]
MRARCLSRILESVLAVKLLTDEQADPMVVKRLTRFIATTLSTSPPDPIQAELGRAVLSRSTPGDISAERAIAAIDHFTAGRKRLMFRTLLAELGVGAFPRIDRDTFDGRGQQSWLHSEMTALKIIAAHGTDHMHIITEQDWAAVFAAARPGPPWQCNNLVRLLSLIALRKHPEHRHAVRQVLPDIIAALGPDGGMPFITGMNIFATATAGLALAGARHTGSTLDAMADGLVASQNPDGGLGFNQGVSQSDVDDTSYGIEFLRAVAPKRHARRIVDAEHFLLAQRNSGGGFPTFARGTPSEIAMTAAAVNALAPNRAYRSVVDDGVRFIAARQRPDGAFERSWSRNATNAVFRAVLACDAAQSDDRGARHDHTATKLKAIDYLVRVQNEDGGWGHQPDDHSDPISTAYAVIALSRAATRGAPLARALDYLVSAQRPDGGYLSRPDQAGPRPLLYDTPVLADISVLLGLAHACAPHPRVSAR